MEADLNQLAQDLGQLLSQKKLTVVTAESCTGGWIAKTITDVAGSSEWFERGYVTYSNAASASTGVSISTTYAPTWEIMKWAKEIDAHSFDFGGIPVDESDGNALAGITAFKRYFSRTKVRVRQEWALEPSPLRLSAARKISTGITSVRELSNGVRRILSG